MYVSAPLLVLLVQRLASGFPANDRGGIWGSGFVEDIGDEIPRSPFLPDISASGPQLGRFDLGDLGDASLWAGEKLNEGVIREGGKDFINWVKGIAKSKKLKEVNAKLGSSC
ncbi:unnamed protein product [Darwinula stevensoni]|uniref:Secreted protein n=1 Tax=Darwinula stevensoni TaxID=69355 RepID=A0A7R8X6L6_9CRUS|nr:unnamed protein product [Darwinula stevensoni]CAG0888308.1 unnamed protein product [Darwinula stevensoni]